MFCSNCGKDIGDSKFCPNCGTAIISNNSVEEDKTESNGVVEEIEATEVTEVTETTVNEVIEEVATAETVEENASVQESSDVASVTSESSEPTTTKQPISKKKKILYIAIPIIILLIVIKAFSGGNNVDTVKLSNGNLAFKITLDEYIEKYNEYADNSIRSHKPNQSEEFYRLNAEFDFLDINNAKKTSNGDGTTIFLWTHPLGRTVIRVDIDDSTNYVIGVRLGESVEVPDSTIQSDMCVAFLPLREDFLDLLKKTNDKHNFAYDNNTFFSYGEDNNNLYFDLLACSKDHYKELSKEY